MLTIVLVVHSPDNLATETRQVFEDDVANEIGGTRGRRGRAGI